MKNSPPADEAVPLRCPECQGIEIVTGSRLHFGLLDTVEPFGGVGVMVDTPVTQVTATIADQFEYSGPDAVRAAAIAMRIGSLVGVEGKLPPCHIHVNRFAPTHCGLGSGTQLAMALAEGISRCLGIRLDLQTLATRIALRGVRSAVGIHGYVQGGLIFESGANLRESNKQALNEIQQRAEPPDSWCAAILSPADSGGRVHGSVEIAKFASLPPSQVGTREELKRIVWEDMMPAASAGDFDAFSVAVAHYNRTSGMLFSTVQGGPFNGCNVSELIGWLIGRDVVGVGQSSWGPGVFAWFESTQQAEEFVRQLPTEIQLVTLARVKNSGRRLQEFCEPACDLPPAQ